MENKTFGEVEFDTGWKTKIEIPIFGKLSKIVVKAKAYEAKDGITSEQEQAYGEFKNNIVDSIAKIQGALVVMYGEASERFSLTMILVDRHGELALLFDDKENEDEGIAVQLYPKMLIESQDDYL